MTSSKSDLKSFIKECIELCNTQLNVSTYKYTLKFSGAELMHLSGKITLNYPKVMLAINHVLINNCNITTIRSIDTDTEQFSIIDNIVNFCHNDVIINTRREVIKVRQYTDYTTYLVDYILESNTANLKQYVESCINIYDMFLANKNKDVLYHFLYKGKINGMLQFDCRTLSSAANPLYETFDCIHNEHTERIKKDIARLKNIEYYKKSGLKRKKSYLFHGESGTGKTATVTAIALYDKRHIIDIPFSKLKTNDELESILSLETINKIPIKSSTVIYLFDEIDVGCDKLNRNNQLNESHVPVINISSSVNNTPVTKNKDDINIGNVLSQFDGIGNYSEMILIGTTNHKDKLDPSLYRELRLTPLYFTFLRVCDATSIINSFFNCKLSSEHISQIPDRKLTPAKLRSLCETYDNMPVNDFVYLLKDV